MYTELKKILKLVPAVIIVCFLLVTAAYAQTFVEPTSAPSAGNQYAPLGLGSGLQQKSGNIWAGTLNSPSGLAVQGPSSYNSTWTTLSGLNTLSVEQFCMGGDCTSLISSASTAKTNVYVTGTSCSGGPCAGDPYTGAQICQSNGFSHLVGIAFGGTAGVGTISMVTCDNNGTSPTSAPTIAANNGSTNILTANTPKTGGGGGGGGGGCGTKGNCQQQ